jgi:hypothetical protein
MSAMNGSTHPDDPRGAAAPEEILMGRMIDGQATEGEHSRFRDMADAHPDLWRRLALSSVQARRLEEAFDAAADKALRVELPDAPRAWMGALMRRSIATAGWAAAVLLAVAWIAGRPAPSPSGTMVSAPAGGLTPAEHLQRYLDSPRVVGELAPILLDTTVRDDGWIEVRFLRRIEEVDLFEPDRVPAVEDLGRLPRAAPATAPPAPGTTGEEPGQAPPPVRPAGPGKGPPGGTG